MGGTGRIVVGLDGPGAAYDALRWAMEEAIIRDCAVEVVTVLANPDLDHDSVERMQDRLIEAASEKVPDPPSVARRCVVGAVATGLVDSSHGAALLVIGRRQVPVIHDTATGSVVEYCSRACECAVVVVPHAIDEAPAREHYRWRSYAGEL